MQIWKKNNIGTGLWIGLSTVLVSGAMVWGFLLLLNLPVEGNIRYFILTLIPNSILFRYYLKNIHYYKTAYTLLAIIVLLFSPLLFFVLSTHEVVWG